MKNCCVRSLAGFQLIAALWSASSMPAAVVTVCDEESLRAALGAGGTVTFACDGSIALTSAIEVTNNVVLDATGRDVGLSGSGVSRVFFVRTNGSLTLVDLKIVNGFHVTEGAGILNQGSLALERCVLSNNPAVNFTVAQGGAVANHGVLTVLDTTFMNNRATQGGAIYNTGSLQVNRSSFIYNIAHGFGGGAISSWVTVRLPTVVVGITNCTFYENTGNPSCDIYKGEQVSPAAILNVVSCTFSTAGLRPIGGTSAGIWVANSIVGLNDGKFINGGKNLGWTNAELSFDLHLGPLTDNGGLTLTRELLPDSPAIDQGNNAVSPLTDQRGVTRPIRDRCDIGALETITSPNPISFQCASATLRVSEGNTNAKVRVLRVGNREGLPSVNFSVMSGTATAGQDFLFTAGTLTFASGQAFAEIVVPILNDATPEGSETLTLTLDSPTNAILGSPSSTLLTIEDEDAVQPGALRFHSERYGVVEGGGEAVFTVTRSGGTNGVVAVNVTTVDETALAGQDYVATNITLTFGDTETTKSFTVAIIDDPSSDGLETFHLTLSNSAGGATIGNPSTTTVTIADRAHALSSCNEASLRAAVNAGGKVQFTCDGTITLTSPLVISNGVYLDAHDHEIAISGGGSVRLFVVSNGMTLALRDLKLVDGFAVGTNATGGGETGGPGEGGAIYNQGGKVLAQGCEFLRNRALGGVGGGEAFPFIGYLGSGGAGRGGVAYNYHGGSITFSNCAFIHNETVGGTAGSGPGVGGGGSAQGGVIYNDGATLQIFDCLALSNRVTSGEGRRHRTAGAVSGVAYGGVIFNRGGSVDLSRSFLTGNTISGRYVNPVYGGAIHQEGGILKLAECHLTGNRAVSGGGLGINLGIEGGYSFGGAISINSGKLFITDTTLEDNQAIGGQAGGSGGPGSGAGGAIFNAGDMVITNSTFANNQARKGLPYTWYYQGSASGGAIHNDGGNIVLSHVTLGGNAAWPGAGSSNNTLYGGGIYSTNGTTTLFDSIVANSPSGSNCYGAVIDGGRNISSDASCNFTAPGSLNSTDPLLGPLADYGGPTPTMALLAGSPALDAASAGTCPTTDQRGIARPFGAACDIGAFESAPPYTMMGRITGFIPTNGVSIAAGTSVASATPSGSYALHGLTAGNYVVTPRSPEAVFVLSNRVVNLLHDTINVDFHSYRSNALTLGIVQTGIAKATFAGEAGQNYHVERSTNFSPWEPYSSHITESSGLFQFNDTNFVPASLRMFRVRKP